MMDARTPVYAPADQAEPASVGLAARLRERTRDLHVAAERSGIIRELLRGGGTRDGYATLLRNLLPAYRELERGLERHADSPGVRLLAKPALYRAGAIEADLVELAGPRWGETLVLLPEGDYYACAIAAAADGDGVGLIAHAYMRYFGDLSGGRIMQRLLAKSLDLGAAAIAYYEFPAIADIAAFKADYRAALDRAGAEIGDAAPVLDAAVAGFEFNIALSEAVHAFMRDGPP
jgi:heme oxygenase